MYPGAPRRHQGPPKRHQGDTQGTPKGHPEAPRAPEAILIENQPKPLSFTVKMAAGTYFAREWRRRHAPFPQPAHKNEVTQCANGATPQARPLYQHRKNPYRYICLGNKYMYIIICLGMCVYVCMCVCMYVCLYVCVCVYVCMHVCMYACMHTCLYAYMCVHMYIGR